MRRLLLAALAAALLVGASVGVASARLADGSSPSAVTARDPFIVPATPPAADPTQDGAWGFRTARELAAELQPASSGSAATPSAAPAGGASATVTVTATVLPVVIIVVDRSGDVTELVTNTEDRGAGDALFIVRRGSAGGEPASLDAATWADARAALRQAAAGTGRIWHG